MGAIDRVSNRDEPEDLDHSTVGRTDQVARAGREVPPDPVDGDTEQAGRVARVMARVLRDDDWDTDHLTDDDRRRYLDGDPRQAIPEHEVERLSRRQSVRDYWGQRAGLDNFILRDPVEYVRDHAAQRRWLGPAVDQDRYVSDTNSSPSTAT